MEKLLGKKKEFELQKIVVEEIDFSLGSVIPVRLRPLYDLVSSRYGRILNSCRSCGS